MSIQRESSGFTRLTTRSGVSMVVSTFGARIVELWVPDKAGVLGNVVLGLPSPEHYGDRANLYLGCTVGRVAGRIPQAHFAGGGLSFSLEPNEGPNQLHGGGTRSFDRLEWELITFESDESVVAEFHYVSPAGEEEYPGELTVVSRYELFAQGVLTCTLTAETTSACPVNLTTHSYWNLSGNAGSTIHDHELTADVAWHVETGEGQLPTGELTPTPHQLSLATPGWDDTFVLAEKDHTTTAAATLSHPPSGRKLELFTTEPALQVYTAGYLPEEAFDDVHVLTAFGGVCLEPQRINDNALLPQFPSIVVEPGETYTHVTTHVFSCL
ncbi:MULTISPECIES: aldose epimerase family protein [Aurantimicrobium]|nr:MULTISPECIES: aldose epimerase family protein [Aurantimicrobium]MDH6255039.1 aldose 1-epimerase [Aurantimicrobium minutum]